MYPTNLSDLKLTYNVNRTRRPNVKAIVETHDKDKPMKWVNCHGFINFEKLHQAMEMALRQHHRRHEGMTTVYIDKEINIQVTVNPQEEENPEP